MDGRGEEDLEYAHSAAMRRIDGVVRRVAETDAAVLITGESGVGKELVARALHRYSPRRAHPFVKVNCAALPLELLESELFGHERGAFTGAHRAKPGKFELAHTGTIFLDEVGELPLSLQAKLLHVLQDHQFARLGSRRDIHVDVRVVAATNRALEAQVEAGAFRVDLYYRLNVVNVDVPPLRERRDEIPILVDRFLTRYAARYGRSPRAISDETMRYFLAHPWPGNIRQLENMVKGIVALDSEVWVLEEMRRRARATPAAGEGVVAPRDFTPAMLDGGLKAIGRRAAAEAERLALEQVLDRVRWNRTEAARLLKVNYKTLLQKIRALKLDDGRPGRHAS